MGSLENLTEEIKLKSVDILEDMEDLVEEENEIETIRNVVDGLHAELQDKVKSNSMNIRKKLD